MIKLPYFEEIDFNSLEDYYETEIQLEEQTVSLDLNLDDEPEETWAQDFATFAPKLPQYHQAIRDAIKGYYPDENGLVREFFTWHMDELTDDMNELADKEDKNQAETDQLLSLLRLNRIGFYFADNNFATWDFTFGDFTDQILVFITDKNGEILDITWES